jgi:hypothetical protein
VVGSTAPRTRRAGPPVFAFAVGGLLVGHTISYLVAVPDPYHRDLVLARTGHGYLPTVAELALVMVLAAAASVVGRTLRRGAGPEPAFASIAVRLAALQVVAFAGQEVTERLVAHVPVAELVRDHVLVIGLATQVLVAVVGALILGLLSRAGATIAEIVRSRSTLPRAALVAFVARPTLAPPARHAVGAIAPRAPPSV